MAAHVLTLPKRIGCAIAELALHEVLLGIELHSPLDGGLGATKLLVVGMVAAVSGRSGSRPPTFTLTNYHVPADGVGTSPLPDVGAVLAPQRLSFVESTLRAVADLPCAGFGALATTTEEDMVVLLWGLRRCPPERLTEAVLVVHELVHEPLFAHGQSDCLRVVSRGASNRIPWRRPKVAAQQHGEDEAGCALELCEGDRDDDEECDAVGLFGDPLVAELEKVLDADDDAHDSSESEESEAEALAEPESLGPEPPTYASVCAGLGLEERGRELFLLGDSAPIGRMEVCCGAMQSLKAVCGR